MSTVIIEVQGLDRLNGNLSAFVAGLPRELQNITTNVGEVLRAKLARYPGTSHSPVLWRSDKQRKAYFAKRREAGLPAKYDRQSDPQSQRIGPSWTVERRGATDAVVGTRVGYARYVQAERYQQPQHRATGWVTDTQAIDETERSGQIQIIAKQATDALIRRTMGR